MNNYRYINRNLLLFSTDKMMLEVILADNCKSSKYHVKRSINVDVRGIYI